MVSMKNNNIKINAKADAKGNATNNVAVKINNSMVKNVKALKMIYFFNEGNKDMKALLGGKGANLAEMTTLGIPVPSGFTITTETCHLYYESGKKFPQGLTEQIDANIARLEKTMGTKFDDTANPLLVSVRSGAASIMPGMMDTILNLGINDQVVEALIRKTKNERFAWDTYRRFIQMFGNVVINIEHHSFDE